MERFDPSIRLGSRKIRRSEERPYLISEIGVNHEGDLSLAKKLIDLSVEGGADAVKFQAYRAGTLAMRNSPSYWDTSKEPTKSQFELFKKYDSFGPTEYEELAEYCQDKKIEFSCTAFDFESVDYLEPLMSFYKISSSDITNIPLLKKIAAKNKPVILSTGAATLGEIETAVGTLNSSGAGSVSLLHCVLNYPCTPEVANLNAITYLKSVFPSLVIGYSDHVPADEGMLTLTYAHFLGAAIIEKHFTDDKTKTGNDHYHAADSNDFKVFLRNVEKVNLLGGTGSKANLHFERSARANARRSLVASREIKKGEKVAASDVVCKRPASGAPPALYDLVVGSEVLRDIAEDSPIRLEDLSGMRTPEVDGGF